MNRYLRTLADDWSRASPQSRRAVHFLFILLVLLPLLVGASPHYCRGSRYRPWMQPRVYVVPGVEVTVVDDTGAPLGTVVVGDESAEVKW